MAMIMESKPELKSIWNQQVWLGTLGTELVGEVRGAEVSEGWQ